MIKLQLDIKVMYPQGAPVMMMMMERCTAQLADTRWYRPFHMPLGFIFSHRARHTYVKLSGATHWLTSRDVSEPSPRMRGRSGAHGNGGFQAERRSGQSGRGVPGVPSTADTQIRFIFYSFIKITAIMFLIWVYVCWISFSCFSDVLEVGIWLGDRYL